MSKRTIHIFNPETDYALAMGRSQYSMPASIRKFRDEMELFPATFASDGDCIAVEDIGSIRDHNPDLFELAARRDLIVVEIGKLGEMIQVLGSGNVGIKPWGWNHTLRRTLLKAGVGESLLKTEEEIDLIRKISHRRTSILFQNGLKAMLPEIGIVPVREFNSSEEALLFFEKEKDAYFKMPWSSSGRGVLHASRLSTEKLRQWLEGCVRKQGSVMAEPAYRKQLDFASEWEIKNGKAEFIGLSLFRTSEEGRYGGNELISQDEIASAIAGSTTKWGDRVIESQRHVLEKICGKHYSGPVGIDMLSTSEGELVPCVELNFRQTMGMAAIGRLRINAEEK